MARNNKLKETDIKSCICYYFDDLININYLHPENVLLEEKSYENILIYYAAYKTSCGLIPLPVVFDKVDGYNRKYVKKIPSIIFSWHIILKNV